MRLFFLLIILLIPITKAHSDAVIVPQAMRANTIAEYYIENKGVRVDLEIGRSGILAFKNLLLNIDLKNTDYSKMNQGDSVKYFFAEEMNIYADEKLLAGRFLSAKLGKRLKRDEVTGETIEQTEEDILKIELFYPLLTKAKLLRFHIPNFDIGFVAYHQGVPVNDFRFLRNNYLLELDWNDPWYSKFLNKELLRKFHTPMSGYLYMEPFEVRKEIILRPKDLQRWFDLNLADENIISVAEQAALKLRIADFIGDFLPVKIDGTVRQGQLLSINFLQRTLRKSLVIEPPEDVALNTAILGLIYSYPVNNLPKNVQMEWDLWDDKIQKVAAATVDEMGSFPSMLDRNWSKLEWENFLTNPTIPSLLQLEKATSKKQVIFYYLLYPSIFLAIILIISLVVKANVMIFSMLLLCLSLTASSLFYGASPTPDKENVRRIVQILLNNIYHSFDYRKESDRYDALLHTVTGELLTEIYLETQRSLLLAGQGGAQVKVKSITVQDIDSFQSEGSTFTLKASWIVKGDVGHWGHLHQRQNYYKAILNVANIEGQWKLSNIEILNEERL